MSFDDVDGDGIDEITLVDDNFAYWNTCYACSPFPRVILRWTGERFAFATDLLRAPAPCDVDRELLIDKLRLAWAAPRDIGADGVSVDAWSIMVDLIYSGLADTAFDLAAKTWPPDAPDRVAFEEVFIDVIAQSQWTDDLATMNGGDFAQRLRAARAVTAASTDQ